MSELKIRRVKLRNWMTVKNAEIEFPDKGLVLVLGNNLASSGKMQSVGAGKTGIGEALSKALAGTTGRFSNLGHYSSDDAGNRDMYVKVDSVLHGKPFAVEMGFKCKELSKTGEGLRFTHGDDPPVERGHILETRSEIASALNITPDLADWTVYIDGDRLKFNKMSERDSVGLLMTALRQPSWEDISKRVAKMTTDAKAAVQQHQSLLEHHRREQVQTADAIAQATKNLAAEKARIAQLESQMGAEATKVQADINAKAASIAKLTARQKEIKKKIKLLEDQYQVAHATAEKQKSSLQTKISEKQLGRGKFVEQRATATTLKRTHDERLREMQAVPAACPTCGKPWDKSHGSSEIEAQQLKIKAQESCIRAAIAGLTKIDDEVKSIRKQIEDIDGADTGKQQHAESVLLSHEYEDNEGAVSSINNQVSSLSLRLQTLQRGPDKSRIASYDAILAERTTKASEIKANLETTASELAEAEELVKVMCYWAEAFGPTGIPNLILSEAIAPLNEIARRISKLMTGGTIEIVYDTSRQLKSGRTSSELVVNVVNKIGSKRLEGSSKGESGLTNLIIAETLAEVGSISSRVGFRWYDEVLNSQDPVVRQSILSYLKDLAERLGILVFVVDHHAETANYADYVLVAEKTVEGTSYYWKS
jgi:DNA repair exonuclease SbcCD ATPase subunit